MSDTAWDHVFDALSKRQIDVLCNVAFGGHGAGCNLRTLRSLEKKALIEEYFEMGPASKYGLAYRVSKWGMIIPVHMAFCDWCSRQEDWDE